MTRRRRFSRCRSPSKGRSGRRRCGHLPPRRWVACWRRLAEPLSSGRLVARQLQPGDLVRRQAKIERGDILRELGAGGAADEGEDLLWLAEDVRQRDLRNRGVVAFRQQLGPIQSLEVLFGAI